MTYDKQNLPHVFVCFEDYYMNDDIPMDELMPIFELRRMVGKGRAKEEKVRRAAAIVMDPVNPTNNLWLSLADATSFIQRARESAEKIRSNII